MSTQALPFKNPEVLGPMGFGLPEVNLRESLDKPIAIAGSFLALGVVAGAGAVAFFGKAEKANAGVEVCTTPTGETPTPQTSPKISGVDLMVYKSALRSRLCVGYESSITSYIENVGTEVAYSVRPSISGRLDAMKTVIGIKINDKSIPILEQNATSTSGEYCNYQLSTDRNQQPTNGINCANGIYQINLAPNEKIKFEAILKPTKAIKADTSLSGPDLSIGAINYPFNEKNIKNNVFFSSIDVADENGNPVGNENLANCNFAKLKLIAPSKVKNGAGMFKTEVTTTSAKITGDGNGASKYASQRSKAARIVVTTSAKTNKLPKYMRRVGNKIFIDISNRGVIQGEPVINKLRFKLVGKATTIKATFFAPKGTIANCSKKVTINSKTIKSTSK